MCKWSKKRGFIHNGSHEWVSVTNRTGWLLPNFKTETFSTLWLFEPMTRNSATDLEESCLRSKMHLPTELPTLWEKHWILLLLSIDQVTGRSLAWAQTSGFHVILITVLRYLSLSPSPSLLSASRFDVGLYQPSRERDMWYSNCIHFYLLVLLAAFKRGPSASLVFTSKGDKLVSEEESNWNSLWSKDWQIVPCFTILQTISGAKGYSDKAPLLLQSSSVFRRYHSFAAWNGAVLWPISGHLWWVTALSQDSRRKSPPHPNEECAQVKRIFSSKKNVETLMTNYVTATKNKKH